MIAPGIEEFSKQFHLEDPANRISIKQISSDYGITSSFIKISKENNDLNLPEAASVAGVLSTISDVVSPSCTSVFTVNKNKNKTDQTEKQSLPCIHTCSF